ncbi:hypothetical protein HPP92_014514 [Vanilla planifolia]|uniref:Uncharacterized protein n=1 Tax=Vanilla planifolia TaxID=51239 RepID=A0A835UST2_VANPL|nr:hypothetical protein HPP92_014514 [Vanilla planifolia]
MNCNLLNICLGFSGSAPSNIQFIRLFLTTYPALPRPVLSPSDGTLPVPPPNDAEGDLGLWSELSKSLLHRSRLEPALTNRRHPKLSRSPSRSPLRRAMKRQVAGPVNMRTRRPR